MDLLVRVNHRWQAGGPGAALGIWMCAFLLQAMGQLSPVRNHGQEHEWARGGGFLMLRACSFVGAMSNCLKIQGDF